jgi:hypothetical protein
MTANYQSETIHEMQVFITVSPYALYSRLLHMNWIWVKTLTPFTDLMQAFDTRYSETSLRPHQGLDQSGIYSGVVLNQG